MLKQVVQTESAPQPSGMYSQAIRVENTVYLSGQIPLVPTTMNIISDDISHQIEQVFKNLSAVANAAGGSLQDIVKLTVYLNDLNNFAMVNETMARFFSKPYPARTTVEVSRLPRDVAVEMDAILYLPR